jgi:Ca2+-binding EF-hand superfamily protein
MNFSPAWILAILHQNNLHSTCEFTISHLNTLLQMIGMDLSSNDILLLFDCFDPKKSGQVSTKSFIDFLLPLNNEVLRNVVAKRIASDL